MCSCKTTRTVCTSCNPSKQNHFLDKRLHSTLKMFWLKQGQKRNRSQHLEFFYIRNDPALRGRSKELGDKQRHLLSRILLCVMPLMCPITSVEACAKQRPYFRHFMENPIKNNISSGDANVVNVIHRQTGLKGEE